MRASVAFALLLAALVLASGASATDPKQPQQRHTAADTKLAQSIALKRSDLPPGWTAAPKQKPPPPCSSEPNEAELVQTTRIDPTFLWTDGLTSVGSEVDIFRTAAQARLDWRLSTLALMRSCLLEGARRNLAPQHVTVSVVSVKALPAPKLGERSLHYRLVLGLRQKGSTVTVPVVTELVGVGVGRTSVVLHALARGDAIPASGLNSLIALLSKRLVGASGGI